MQIDAAARSGPVAAVTGGTGFLGRYVVAALLREGFAVRLLTRRAPDAAQSGVLRAPTAAQSGVLPVAGTLEDADSLRRLVEDASVVVHLAGLVKARHAAAFHAVNRDGAARLAAITARHAPRARVILVSSQAAREPLLSAYAASKRAGELAAIAALGATPWVVLRPCVIYGPGDREGRALLQLAQRRIAPVLRSPEPRLAMIHATDAAAAIATLGRAGPSGVTYELTDARVDGYGWAELLQTIGACFGREPYRLPVPDLLIHAAGALSDGLAALSGRPALFGRGKAREFLHRDWSSDLARQPPPALWRPGIALPAGFTETVAWWQAGLCPNPPKAGGL